jgi:hypothetical protein
MDRIKVEDVNVKKRTLTYLTFGILLTFVLFSALKFFLYKIQWGSWKRVYWSYEENSEVNREKLILDMIYTRLNFLWFAGGFVTILVWFFIVSFIGIEFKKIFKYLKLHCR